MVFFASAPYSQATEILLESSMTLSRALAALAALGALAASGAVFADTDCSDPVATWKPREVLRLEVERRGWTVQRIKVDDGCYEVRGVDRMGNKIKAKYAPASLRIRSLEVEFGPAGDDADYGRPQPATAKPANNPAHQGHIP
jgi:hypothetical protein